jgi:hypothetical protein
MNTRRTPESLQNEKLFQPPLFQRKQKIAVPNATAPRKTGSIADSH